MIKTFEEACEVLGMSSVIPDFDFLIGRSKKQHIALYKLTIITIALNDGWVPNWDDENEYKYFPLFNHISGLSFSGVNFTWTGSSSVVDANVCFKTSELAQHAGKTFIQLFKDLLQR